MSEYLPLPAQAAEICQSVSAPPRLVAHLMLVHDVACKLTQRLQDAFPDLAFDPDLVRFGAAIHDIGKAIRRNELTGPGNLHERDGVALLLKAGVSEERTRFCRTHARWEEESMKIEDLLVALADKCWKGKRQPELEEKIVLLIAQATGKESWEVFSILDELLQNLAADADARLAWQAKFPV